MKIAIFAFGAVDYSVALADALSKYCQVHFYCTKYFSKDNTPSILDVLNNNVRIRYFDNYRIRSFRNLFSYYKLSKEIRDGNFDILHFQTGAFPWFLIFRNIWRSIPLVSTVHDPYQHPGLPLMTKIYEDIMQKFCVKFSKKIIVHGDMLKKRFLKRYPEKNFKDVKILPHGDFSIYKNWEVPNCNSHNGNVKTILFFGNITPYKGLEYLIKAEPLISEIIKDYKIVIAGRGLTANHKKYISDFSKFQLVDTFIPNEDVPKYFADASIVVLPYISASQSGIIHLAYTFGKPVIATNVGALPEIVNNGKTGLLVEPRNESVLADAVIRLLSDNDLLGNMSKNVTSYCENNLSWNTIAKKTVNLYENVLNTHT